MKLRHIAIALASAGYVAGASAGVLDWLFDAKPAANSAVQTRFTAPKNITKEEAQRSAQQRQKQWELVSKRMDNPNAALTANTHRAGVQSSIPFVREKNASGEHSYIVQLSDAPIALYKGGVSGLQAVVGKHGAAFNAKGKLNTQSNVAKSYASYLSQRQSGVLNTIRAQVKGNAAPFHYYKNAFNGMAMVLTQDQAEAVSKLPGVKSVTRSKLLKLHTDIGPTHIGADKIWDATAFLNASPNLGEGIIAAVLDTGINSDHPSFAALGGDGYLHTNPWGDGVYKGDCANAEFAAMCNDKLIGVRSYPEITNAYKDWELLDPNTWQPKRPATGEDYHGHGSHTASTVAGNVLFNVPFSVPTYDPNSEHGDGFALPHTFARISGVAPHANVIAYQVCYYGDAGDKFAGCPESATLKAIDDAIADGADVINYSIGGGEGFPWQSPSEVAFLAAREAGISVAAAAGNSGGASRDHSSPWLTAVAATTHERVTELQAKTLSDFSGGDPSSLYTIQGKSFSGGITAPVVAAANFDNPNSSEADDLCEQPYDAGTFNGEIVVCRRGLIGRVQKGVNVLAGGAGGMILYDDPADTTTPSVYEIGNDPHVLPAIHIDSYSGTMVVEWLGAGSGHQATISDVNLTIRYDAANADAVAEFSSRGPSATVKNVMFPSVAAPGVDVFAAYADEHPFSASSSGDYTMISGTSMASPHVAGALALLRNSHPDWTPSEIQSALMMTAVPAHIANWWGPSPEAGVFDAGSGAVRVNQAVAASLVLDETSDNFRAADPSQGGMVSNLNMPYLVDRDCRDKCTWVRTVRATRDGTWNVNVVDKTAQGASVLSVDVSPATFTLQAGQTQTILVRAKTEDVNAQGGDKTYTSEFEDRFADVQITPADASPTLHLPVVVRWGSAGLPVEINADAHRSTGRNVANPVLLPEYSQLTTRAYGLVKADVTIAHLSAAQAWSDSTPEDLMADEGVGHHFEFIDVPVGTKRLVVDVWPKKAGSNAFPTLDLGRDVNDNGVIEWNDEAICYSIWLLRNFCAINNPMPGRYWIMVGNEKWVDTWNGQVDTVDEVQWAYGLVTEDDLEKGNLTISGPASNDGRTPVDLAVNWNLPGLQQGEVYYGAFDVGSDANNAGNLGTVAVRVEHVGPDLAVTASQQTAKAGDVVEYTVNLDPNLFAHDRNYNINVTLPEGLKVMAGSARTVGNAGLNTLSSDDQHVTLSGTQQATANVGRHYLFSNSDNDANCRVPGSEDGKLLNLRQYGYTPMAGVVGLSQQALQMEAKLFWGEDAHVPLYGVKREHTQGYIGISPGGFVQYDPMVGFFPFHYPMEASFSPDIMVAPYWRGPSGIPEVTYDDGVMAARDSVAGLQYFQWDNVHDMEAFMNWEPDVNARYNYQAVVSENISFEEGDYEVVFAYGTMKGDLKSGSVGTHGYYGPRNAFNPELGWIGDSVGYDNLTGKVRSDLVICGNYDGPERSAIVLQFAAKVGAAAIGSALDVSVASAYSDAETITVTKPLTVVGNIVVSGLGDVETQQNETVSDIPVVYVDRLPTANTIEVSGAHISATVHGDSAGSTFDLTPETDWFGHTTVTVTVYDKTTPNDRHSQSFKLTVHPVATAIVAADRIDVVAGEAVKLDASGSWASTGHELTFVWQQTAGSALTTSAKTQAALDISSVPEGSYEFTVTVNDGVSSDSKVVKITATAAANNDDDNGGGGSVPVWLVIIGLALARHRRR